MHVTSIADGVTTVRIAGTARIRGVPRIRTFRYLTSAPTPPTCATSPVTRDPAYPYGFSWGLECLTHGAATFGGTCLVGGGVCGDIPQPACLPCVDPSPLPHTSLKPLSCHYARPRSRLPEGILHHRNLTHHCSVAQRSQTDHFPLQHTWHCSEVPWGASAVQHQRHCHRVNHHAPADG